MLSLPWSSQDLLKDLSGSFTHPTWNRFLRLCVGAIVTWGPRTITNIVWSARAIMPGHVSSYHRVFSRASWSLWPLARAIAAAILKQVPSDQPVMIAIDDTTAGHRGPKVYGRGCHRDATRSSHGMTVYRWGHRWVVLAVLVSFPFSRRPWALPVVCALYRPREVARKQNVRFKTPPMLARQLMRVLIRWFPQRKFVFLGDGGFATHNLAMFCHRHRSRATRICRFYDDACLYAPPPKRQGPVLGRPAMRGRKLANPKDAVSRNTLTEAIVHWYGGADRKVAWISQTGGWWRNGVGLVPLRWVFVHDQQGTHRDEYLACTDPAMDPSSVIDLYTSRWSVEVTFQEIRRHLGFETTKQRVKQSILRMAPCLLGLFSLVSLIYAQQHRRYPQTPSLARPWYVKTEPTFSDALQTVRRLFWQNTFMQGPWKRVVPQNWPRSMRRILLERLSAVA
jgi:hypothetical protein